MGWYRREFDDVLGPAEAHLLQEAFHEALLRCGIVKHDGHEDAAEDFLAREIIAAAKQGERDPTAMADHAVSRFLLKFPEHGK